MVVGKYQECASCGGAGGGPFGPAGSAWDTEDYVCPRCQGTGVVLVVDASVASTAKKGIVKAAVPSPQEAAGGRTNKRVG